MLRFSLLCNDRPPLFTPCSSSLHKTQNPNFTHLNNFSTTIKTHQILAKSNRGYATVCPCASSFPSSLPDDGFEVELDRLLALLPEEMRRRINEHREFVELIEVVMDLGRKPLARFPSGDFVLSDEPITMQDIEHATSMVGDFAIDNRAGISRTLHRISGIRNRKGTIIGLTCRVGRAISGSANLLRDLVQNGASLLLIGPPGDCIYREIARMLANDYKKRVMIVDTSNEIGGDGDIPHAGIGSARRMQVPNNDMQHKVLIEAVENHMPQVIVIDEIGTKLEAMAASTIAQRGIQLVATAHGVTIENLIMNPSLEMLVGGDEEANRRGVQKTVLERKGPSTFSCAVEIVSKTELRIHRSLEATVDSILSGRNPNIEIRKINIEGSVESVIMEPFTDAFTDKKHEVVEDVSDLGSDERDIDYEFTSDVPANLAEDFRKNDTPLRLYVYGILESSVVPVIRNLQMEDEVQLADNFGEADAMLALHAKLKKNTRIQAAAKSQSIPIYVTKTSSLVHITKAIQALMSDYAGGLKGFESGDKTNKLEQIDALEEARIAIEQVIIPKGEAVELLPRPSHIMSLQMDLIQKYQLNSEKIGKETGVCLRILPFQSETDAGENSSETTDLDNESEELKGPGGNTNGSVYSTDRLPLLPD
ncbi:hypothetical protein ACFE04_023442 [Oxalis oulophora]